MSAPPDIEGFEKVDGWYVETKRRALIERIRRSPAPRRYTIFDQIAVEVTAPASLFVYSLSFALITYGALDFNWFAIIAGTGGLVFFGRSFVSLIKTVRRGVVATVVIRKVQYDVGRGQGVNENMQVDDKTMNVGFDLAVVRPLLELTGAVEAEVLYDPKDAQPLGHAVAYRVPETLPTTGES